MNSFEHQLFHKLKETVLQSMPPRDQYEVNFFKIFSEMLAEAEMLVVSKKIRKDSLDSNDGAGHSAQPKSKEEIEKERLELENALSDDKLCQICFTRELDT